MSLLLIEERGIDYGERALGGVVVSFFVVVACCGTKIFVAIVTVLPSSLVVFLCISRRSRRSILLLLLQCDEDSSFFSIDSFNLAKLRRCCFAASYLSILCTVPWGTDFSFITPSLVAFATSTVSSKSSVCWQT